MLKHLYVEIDATASKSRIGAIVKQAAKDLLPASREKQGARKQAVELLTGTPSTARDRSVACRASQLASRASRRIAQAPCRARRSLTPRNARNSLRGWRNIAAGRGIAELGERRLAAQFGDAYSAYRARTDRGLGSMAERISCSETTPASRDGVRVLREAFSVSVRGAGPLGPDRFAREPSTRCARLNAPEMTASRCAGSCVRSRMFLADAHRAR